MHHHPFHFGRRGGPFGPGHGPGHGHGRGGPFGGRDFGDMFGGPPPRADRGVVRYLILDAIDDQERHGYEIIQRIGERSGGTYRPSPGVIYPNLQMLEEMGHAKLDERDGRKVYRITADGKKDLAEHRDEVRDFYEHAGEGSWEDFADDLRDLTGKVGRMFKTIGRAARRGRLTPTMMRKLRGILDETLTRIEEIVDAERR
jgi:DNA-binding PadR family transcriptional regulator